MEMLDAIRAGNFRRALEVSRNLSSGPMGGVMDGMANLVAFLVLALSMRRMFSAETILAFAKFGILLKITLNDINSTARNMFGVLVFMAMICYMVSPLYSYAMGSEEFAIFQYQEEVLLTITLFALVQEALWKLYYVFWDEQKLPYRRIKGLCVLCVLEGVETKHFGELGRESGAGNKAHILAIQRRDPSKPMHWFPGSSCRVHVGDLVFISCSQCVTMGEQAHKDGTLTDAMKLARHLGKKKTDLIEEVEFACTILDKMTVNFCGNKGTVVGPKNFRPKVCEEIAYEGGNYLKKVEKTLGRPPKPSDILKTVTPGEELTFEQFDHLPSTSIKIAKFPIKVKKLEWREYKLDQIRYNDHVPYESEEHYKNKVEKVVWAFPQSHKGLIKTAQNEVITMEHLKALEGCKRQSKFPIKVEKDIEDVEYGSLNFRDTSGGITLVGIIKEDGQYEWFPGPSGIVKTGHQLLVVSHILKAGESIAKQDVDLKKHLEDRMFKNLAFEDLGGELPFMCKAMAQGGSGPRRKVDHFEAFWMHIRTSMKFGPQVG